MAEAGHGKMVAFTEVTAGHIGRYVVTEEDWKNYYQVNKEQFPIMEK